MCLLLEGERYVCPSVAKKAYRGVEVWLHSFLSLTVDGDEALAWFVSLFSHSIDPN